jgi:hypothetical protein
MVKVGRGMEGVGGQGRHLRRCGLLVWIVNSKTEYMHLYIVSYLGILKLYSWGG